MGDLISRKDAINRMIQETEESGKSVMHINTIKRLLQDVDTAYDTERVVEQIESLNACKLYPITFNYIFQIVRKGGAE